MKLFVSFKEDNGKGFVYVCDPEIKGKKVLEGKKQIDLANSYYEWKELEENAIIQMIKGKDAITFFGINSVSLGQKLNLLEISNATYICGIPYCFIILK